MTTIKSGVIANQMRDSAKLFRATAINPNLDQKDARIYLQVQDYENCAEYIEALEERISELQIQAIRARNVAAA